MIRMKNILFALVLARLLLPEQAGAAISNNTSWEVRPTLGASTNGGGFVQGAAGTNYSLNDNKNASGCSNCGSSTDDLSTTDAVAVGTTTITSLTANFSTVIVGSVVYFQGGTGSISAVRREVTARASTTSITIDAAIAASTGMTMNIGGSLDDIATALLANTASNIIFVKATGTLVKTATTTCNNSLTPSRTAPPNQIIGYTTTRGDNGRFTLQLSTNSGLVGIACSADGWYIRNAAIDCNSLSGCIGIQVRSYSMVYNCKISNYRTSGVQNTFDSPGALILFNEITGGTTGASEGVLISSTAGSVVANNYIHDGVGYGILIASARRGQIVNNIVDTMTTVGIGVNTDYGAAVLYNTIYGSGTFGIEIDADSLLQGNLVRNNLVVNSGTWGFSAGATAGDAAFPQYDGNGYFNNTSGNRRSMDDTGATVPINGAAPYTNVFDVILTADPFTNGAGGDFTLNSTAGGGAAVKGVGTPGTIPGVTGTGYPDLGAFQSQAPAASTGCACGFSK